MPQRVAQSKHLGAPLQGGRIKLARDGMILLHQTVAVCRWANLLGSETVPGSCCLLFIF